jgi:hypothetical protein
MMPESEAVKAAPSLIAQHYFTEEDLAAELGKNIRTLRRWKALRFGPPVTRAGKRILYSKQGVLDWLRSQEQRQCREHRARVKPTSRQRCALRAAV